MKKLFIFVCLILSALSLYARAIQEDYRRADEKVRMSYASGMIIGSNLREAGLEFDYTAFAEGLKAVLENNEAQFSEQEAVEIVEIALQAAMEKKAEENRLREEEFLSRNRERGVQVTQTGLQYEILADTDGEKPKSDSVVRVNYTGTFMDGRIFDNSDGDEGGAYIPLERVIPGWTEGLMLMSVGSEYRFYIPSELAYGRDGIPNLIPPFSTLIFTVELLEIVNEEDDPAEES